MFLEFGGATGTARRAGEIVPRAVAAGAVQHAQRAALIKQLSDRFELAEELLDAFSLLRASQIGRMTSCPFFNDSSDFASRSGGT